VAQSIPIIESSWKEALLSEFNTEYFQQLQNFLAEDKKQHEIYPPESKIFSAFLHRKKRS
jgi:uracil DNA glycosylase